MARALPVGRPGDEKGGPSAPVYLSPGKARAITIAAMLAGLWLCVELRLIGALFAGLLVHELVHALAPRLTFGRRAGKRERVLSVGLIATVVIGALVAAGFGVAALLGSEGASPSAILARMADIIASSRSMLPAWIADHLPSDADALGVAIVDMLRAHASQLQHVGREFGVGLVHIVIGMVVGAIICFREVHASGEKTLLLREASERVMTLARAFRGVVFAQVKISAINTVLTAIYLAGVLPAMGVHLPYTKALIALTFFAGLLPVVGNLISNTVIVVVSLAQSFLIALASLTFLVVIHKLEYFLNARIVGSQIHASAWELLCAMLVMEAAFGLQGLVAAPIFYAYAKAELRQLGLI